jgi:septal ring factor EnvC (AmiA/AmiB activator)
LKEEVRKVRSQLEQERADREEVEAQLKAEKTRHKELEEEFRELDDQWSDCKKEIHQLEAELVGLRQKSVAASKDLPEAADFYNQFKAKNPKTKITYNDVTKILAMIEKSCDDTSQE